MSSVVLKLSMCTVKAKNRVEMNQLMIIKMPIIKNKRKNLMLINSNLNNYSKLITNQSSQTHKAKQNKNRRRKCAETIEIDKQYM